MHLLKVAKIWVVLIKKRPEVPLPEGKITRKHM